MLNFLPLEVASPAAHARDEVSRLLIALCASIDPNWSTVKCQWVSSVSAVMNCPSKGDVDLLPLLENVLTPARLTQLRGGWDAFLLLANPNHEIQLVPGKTKIYFEHCHEAMIVELVDAGAAFVIQYDENGGFAKEKYTLDQLKRELASGEDCVACEVGYAPFLTRRS